MGEFRVILPRIRGPGAGDARRQSVNRDWLMTKNPHEPHDAKKQYGDGDLQDDDDSEKGPEVSPIVVEAIGKALQSHYRAIAELPLPDRLVVLLAELEARERRNES